MTEAEGNFNSMENLKMNGDPGQPLHGDYFFYQENQTRKQGLKNERTACI